jgi:hypothetical protein
MRNPAMRMMRLVPLLGTTRQAFCILRSVPSARVMPVGGLQGSPPCSVRPTQKAQTEPRTLPVVRVECRHGRGFSYVCSSLPRRYRNLAMALAIVALVLAAAVEAKARDKKVCNVCPPCCRLQLMQLASSVCVCVCVRARVCVCD